MAKTKAGTRSTRLAELLIDLAIDNEFRDWFNRDRAAAIASRKLPKAAASALRKATKKVRKTAKKR